MFISSKVMGSRLAATLSTPMQSEDTRLSVMRGILMSRAGAAGRAGSFCEEYFCRVCLSRWYFSVAQPYSLMGAS